MKTNELSLYRGLLGDIKTRVRQAQHRAALSANAEMLLMYWDIGRMIAARQQQEGWGTRVIPHLAADLKNELPDQKGFSETNIKRMVRFWEAYPELFLIGPPAVAQIAPPDSGAIGPRAVAQLPTPVGASDLQTNLSPTISVHQVMGRLSWAHNVILLEKLKDLPIRKWYAEQAFGTGLEPRRSDDADQE